MTSAVALGTAIAAWKPDQNSVAKGAAYAASEACRRRFKDQTDRLIRIFKNQNLCKFDFGDGTIYDSVRSE